MCFICCYVQYGLLTDKFKNMKKGDIILLIVFSLNIIGCILISDIPATLGWGTATMLLLREIILGKKESKEE